VKITIETTERGIKYFSVRPQTEVDYAFLCYTRGLSMAELCANLPVEIIYKIDELQHSNGK